MTTMAMRAPASLWGSLTVSRSLGKEADKLGRLHADALRHLREPLSITSFLENALTGLAQSAREASVPDWDGYGALPAEPRAIAAAARLLMTLPTTTPVPEIWVDPDGEVALNWDFGKDWVFSVSIGPTGKLSYAGLYGSGKAYGAEQFATEIPPAVLDNLSRLLAGHPDRQ